jgi:hypothetical protein
LKDNYSRVTKAYAAYQKKLSQPSPSTVNPDSLEAMTSAVTKKAAAMLGSKSGAGVVDRIQHGRKNSIIAWINVLRIKMSNSNASEKQCQKVFGGQTKLKLASLSIVHGKSLISSSPLNER